ncbi:hypothetical protein CfE428DRAFT_5552 [Chthoniobacter flavus Ellin428]|uniref:Uncharacterized protein n=1 Tax=Chthoniobacter flavus Ellin428 TaxID=497964 RepID=B4D9G2_9BACT|nr:hypothetical protein CfE428DRAFT_5552 [Chthoniobacter flavus Ellin428]
MPDLPTDAGGGELLLCLWLTRIQNGGAPVVPIIDLAWRSAPL